MPPYFAVGLILVGCCPGGTASNLLTYIAKADVARSVVMTVCSTLAAIILTPILTQLFAGALVPVDIWMLFKQTLQVVILPVVLGVLFNRWVPHLVKRVMPVVPLLSVLGVCVICAIVFAVHAQAILKYGAELILATAMLHGGGFLMGYYFARIFGYHPRVPVPFRLKSACKIPAWRLCWLSRLFQCYPWHPLWVRFQWSCIS